MWAKRKALKHNDNGGRERNHRSFIHSLDWRDRATLLWTQVKDKFQEDLGLSYFCLESVSCLLAARRGNDEKSFHGAFVGRLPVGGADRVPGLHSCTLHAYITQTADLWKPSALCRKGVHKGEHVDRCYDAQKRVRSHRDWVGPDRANSSPVRLCSGKVSMFVP